MNSEEELAYQNQKAFQDAALDALHSETQPNPIKELEYKGRLDHSVKRKNQNIFLVSSVEHNGKSALRVWAACKDGEDVRKRIAKIRARNPYAMAWDIFSIEAGKWAEWPPNFDRVERVVYENEDMEKFIGANMESTKKAVAERERQEVERGLDVQANRKREKAARRAWTKKIKERAERNGSDYLVELEAAQRERQERIEAGESVEHPEWSFHRQEVERVKQTRQEVIYRKQLNETTGKVETIREVVEEDVEVPVGDPTHIDAYNIVSVERTRNRKQLDALLERYNREYMLRKSMELALREKRVPSVRMLSVDEMDEAEAKLPPLTINE